LDERLAQKTLETANGTWQNAEMPSNSDTPKPDKHAVRQAARDKRLKEALRVNLQRRKQKARALRADEKEAGTDDT